MTGGCTGNGNSMHGRDGRWNPIPLDILWCRFGMLVFYQLENRILLALDFSLTRPAEYAQDT